MISAAVVRPPPSAMMACPIGRGGSACTTPLRSASTSPTQGACGSRAGSSTTRTSPPCASMIWRNFCSAAPLSIARRNVVRALWIDVSGCASRSISIASASVTVQRSAGPPPRSASRHSFTSSALPQASPSGRSMAVSSVMTGTPASRPSAIIVCASSNPRSSSGRNAPLPLFTSSTSPVRPSDSFLLMMLAAIS